MAWLRTEPREAGTNSQADALAAEAPVEDAGRYAASIQSAAIAAGPVAAPSIPPGSLNVAIPTPMPSALRDERTAPLRLAHTDWLHHRLLVTGPAADLAGFRAAAAGAGVVPWHLDIDRMAEDFFHLLAAPPARAGSLVPPARSLSLSGARILADQLCAAAAQRHALATRQVGHSRVCPFDLHALVPVPEAVLRRGPDDPDALDWLWAHWGTTQPLRHVAEIAAPMRAPAKPGEAVWAVAFWSADWTPWRALTEIAARWPRLHFDTRPTYGTT
jgi:hypothetical protein